MEFIEVLIVFEIADENKRLAFISNLKKLGAWSRIVSNAFIVRSESKTAMEVRDKLKYYSRRYG